MARKPPVSIFGKPIRRRIETWMVPTGLIEREIAVWDTDRGFTVVEGGQEYPPPRCPWCGKKVSE